MTRPEKRALPDGEINVAPDAQRTRKDGGAQDEDVGYFAIYYQYPDGTVKAHELAFEWPVEDFLKCRYTRDVARIVKEGRRDLQHVQNERLLFCKGEQIPIRGVRDFLDAFRGSSATSPVQILCPAPVGAVPDSWLAKMTRPEKRALPDGEINVAPDAQRTREDGGARRPVGYFAIYYQYPDGTVKAHRQAFNCPVEYFLKCRYTMDVARIVKEVRGGLEHGKDGDLQFCKGEQIPLDDVDDFLHEFRGSSATSPIQILCPAPVGAVPGTLRRRAWLKQKLPPLVYDRSHASRTTGLRSTSYSHWPDSAKLWDLSRDVDEYLADAATKDSYHKPIDMQSAVNMVRLRTEADSQGLYKSLLTEVGLGLFGASVQVLSQASLSSLSSSNQQSGEATMTAVANATHLASDYCVDLALQLRSRNFLLVEMKRPSFFRETPEGPIPDLVVAYEHRDDTRSDGNRYPVLAEVVNKLFTYMCTGRVSYGIISSADLSYFVWARSDALHISEGVAWQDEKFVAVLSYFLEKAAKDSTEFSGKEGHESSQDKECTSEVSDDDPMSDHKDDNFKGPRNLKNSPTSVVTRSQGKGASGGKWTTVLKEMPAELLHLESHPFATGWSGNIVRGMYKGVAIAVKLALVGTERAEALVNEASAYLKLRDCWGTYVPALISYGTTAIGRVVYVATEFVVGSELEMGNLTGRVVRSSFEALRVIHSFGVLHGDVRRQNILVPFSREQGVRFIDFGFSRAIATEKDCRKELQELRGVVRGLGRGTVPLSFSPPAIATKKDCREELQDLQGVVRELGRVT